MKFYVVLCPKEIKGIYEDWESCKNAVSGAKGARYQSAKTREEAERILSGQELKLEQGLYAFTDGNHLGGVGCVIVKVDGKGREKAEKLSSSVFEVFSDILNELELEVELERIRQILAELGGFRLALTRVEKNSSITIVHDYIGISEWMEKRWKIKDRIVYQIVNLCRRIIEEKNLKITFRHQKSHHVIINGRDPFIEYNQLADELAREAI